MMFQWFMIFLFIKATKKYLLGPTSEHSFEWIIHHTGAPCPWTFINIAACNASVPPANAVWVSGRAALCSVYVCPLSSSTFLLFIVFFWMFMATWHAMGTMPPQTAHFNAAQFCFVFCLVRCRFFASESHILHRWKPRWNPSVRKACVECEHEIGLNRVSLALDTWELAAL